MKQIGRPAASDRRRQDAGVTLVEILVVLVLIGILASAIGLGINLGDRADALQNQAVVLAARLEQAAEDALVRARAARFMWDEEGYHFQTYAAGNWQPHPVALLGQPMVIAPPIRLRAGDAGTGVFVLSPDMLNEQPLTVRFTANGNERQVLFDGISAQILARATP